MGMCTMANGQMTSDMVEGSSFPRALGVPMWVIGEMGCDMDKARCISRMEISLWGNGAGGWWMVQCHIISMKGRRGLTRSTRKLNRMTVGMV